MKYTMFIFFINSFFQVIMGLQIIFDVGNNLEKYLSFNNHQLNILIGILLILANILIIILVHKRYNRPVIIISALLSSFWILFFYNAIINDHYRFLTPLILLISFIEITRANYNMRLSKNE